MSNGNDAKSQPQNKPTDAMGDLGQSDVVPPNLESALRNVGVDPRSPYFSQALEISLTMMSSGVSLVPPPAILKEYGKIRPELVDKVLLLIEQQSAHRREMERCRTVGMERRLDRSQWIGGSRCTWRTLFSGSCRGSDPTYRSNSCYRRDDSTRKCRRSNRRHLACPKHARAITGGAFCDTAKIQAPSRTVTAETWAL
jgi:Predicted membrane protein (DUF2335)